MEQAVQKTLTVPAEDHGLEVVRRFVESALHSSSLDRDRWTPLIEAVHTAAAAFVEGAGSSPVESRITVSLDIDDVRFKARVVDSRVEFGTPRKRCRRALRLVQLQSRVDEIQYQFQRGFENRIEMLKFL